VSSTSGNTNIKYCLVFCAHIHVNEANKTRKVKHWTRLKITNSDGTTYFILGRGWPYCLYSTYTPIYL